MKLLSVTPVFVICWLLNIYGHLLRHYMQTFRYVLSTYCSKPHMYQTLFTSQCSQYMPKNLAKKLVHYCIVLSMVTDMHTHARTHARTHTHPHTQHTHTHTTHTYTHLLSLRKNILVCTLNCVCDLMCIT